MHRLRAREGKAPYRFPRQFAPGIGDRRRDRRKAGLTDTARLLGRSDDRHLNIGHLADAQRAIAVEIGLLHDTALAQRQLGIERMAEAIADPALHLRADDVGVHRDPAIDRAPHFMDLGQSVGADRNLGDLRDKAVKALMHRHAPGTTLLR